MSVSTIFLPKPPFIIGPWPITNLSIQSSSSSSLSSDCKSEAAADHERAQFGRRWSDGDRRAEGLVAHVTQRRRISEAADERTSEEEDDEKWRRSGE